MEISKEFPEIVNVTDLRYRWTKISAKLESGQTPILIIEHSKPKALIIPYPVGLTTRSKEIDDPIYDWRKKYAQQYSGWNTTKVVREQRNSRWNLS